MSEEIMRILRENSDVKELESNMVVKDVYCSLDFCNCIWELEYEISKEFPDDQVKTLYHGTVGELLAYVKKF